MSSNTHFLLACALTGALAIPMALKWIPPNPIYGFRTPATLASPALWYRINAFAGWAMLAASIASGIWLGLIRTGHLPGGIAELAAFLLPLAAAVVTSFIHLRNLGGTRDGSR